MYFPLPFLPILQKRCKKEKLGRGAIPKIDRLLFSSSVPPCIFLKISKDVVFRAAARPLCPGAARLQPAKKAMAHVCHSLTLRRCRRRLHWSCSRGEKRLLPAPGSRSKSGHLPLRPDRRTCRTGSNRTFACRPSSFRTAKSL